jgi:Ca2+-binding RTX toxin-like protein
VHSDRLGLKMMTGSGADTIVGTLEANLLIGGFGSDKLFGHAGRDRLEGNQGDDRLDGGSGVDFLIGDEVLTSASMVSERSANASGSRRGR